MDAEGEEAFEEDRLDTGETSSEEYFRSRREEKVFRNLTTNYHAFDSNNIFPFLL